MKHIDPDNAMSAKEVRQYLDDLFEKTRNRHTPIPGIPGKMVVFGTDGSINDNANYKELWTEENF